MRARVAELERAALVREAADDKPAQGEVVLQSILQNVPLVVWSIDADGVFTSSEGSGLEGLGLQPGEVVGKSAFDVYARVPEIAAQLHRALAGESFHAQVLVDKRTFESWFLPLRGPGGRVTGVLGVSVDITARKQAELDARAAQQFSERLFESTVGAIACLDREGRFVDANRAAAQFADRPIDDLLKMNVADFNRSTFRADGTPFLHDEYPAVRCLRTGEPQPATLVGVRRATGELRWGMFSAAPLRNPETGELTGCVLMCLDVTEQRRIEERLRESERLYASLYGSMREGIAYGDMEGRIVDANPAYLEMLGYTLEELQKLKYTEFTPRRWHSIEAEIVRTQVLAHGTSDLYEKEYIRKDGTIVPVSIRVWLREDPVTGKPIGMWGLVHDLTEQRRSQNSQRQLTLTEARFRQTVENANDAILIVEPSGAIAFANPRCFELFELAPDAGPPERFLDLFVPEERDVIAARFAARMEGKAVEQRYEARLQTRQGRERWGELSVSLIGDGTDVHGMLCFIRDITEQRQSEAELQYHHRFEQLIMSISTHFIHLAPERIDAGLWHALDLLGQFAQVDRAYIMLLDETGRVMRNSHEWCAAGIASQQEQLQAVSLDDFPWFEREVLQRGVFHITSARDLPKEAANERLHFLTQQINSLAVVPMFVDQTLIGFLGFDAVRQEKKWDADSVVLLRIVGEIFATAIARARADEALRISEERFRRLVEHATDAFFVHDLDGKICDVNEGACVSLRYTREELLSMYLWQIDPALTPERIVGLWKQMLPGAAVTFTGLHWRKDGVAFPAEMRLGLYMQGEQQLILALVRDVTERKRAEDALRTARDELELRVQERSRALSETNRTLKEEITERKAAVLELEKSQALWRSLVENAPDYILMMDRQGAILFLNREDPVLAAQLSVQADDGGEPTERQRMLRQGLGQMFATGAPVNLELSAADKDGHDRWYAIRLGPIKREGQPTAAIVIARDITYRKEAEESSRQHRDELAHVARLSTIGEMAAEMAHELNQPLAAIANYASGCTRRLRGKGEVSEDLLSALREINTQSSRASQLIRRMRGFVRKREARRAYVDVNQRVRDVVALANFEARKHQATLALNLDDSLPEVFADSIQIEQVILNLVLNGLESMVKTPEELREVKVCTLSDGPESVEVQVWDRGRGFSRETSERMFDPFFTTRDAGLGLGLSISRSIVEAHGGKLWASLNPLGGALFRFVIPVHGGEKLHEVES
ncbi:MAG TPA: PAS domain S-box protein [Planctomycetaceae bacterium]|nr:PAS domain S-box protein [Planctomycetaceae bacterium]